MERARGRRDPFWEKTMPKYASVAAATIAALAMTTALGSSPLLAQIGPPATQPSGPQTGSPPQAQPGASAPATAAPAPGTPPSGASASGASSSSQAAAPGGPGSLGSAAGQTGEHGQDEASARPRRWYEAESERNGGDDRRWSESDADRGDRADRGNRAEGGERPERGQGRRFGQADGWRYNPGGEERFGNRWEEDRGDGHGFGRADREDMRQRRDWGGRGMEPWRPNREAFHGEEARGGQERNSRRGSQGAGAEVMGPHMIARICGPDGGARMLGGMLDRLERITEPKDTQRASFDRLVDAAEKARDLVRASCPTDDMPVTLPGRVAGAEKRVAGLLDAIRTLRPALDDFYGSLSEEQKARLYMNGERGNRGVAERWRERRMDGGNVGGMDRWRNRGGERSRDGGEDDEHQGFDPGQRNDDRDGWLDDWRGPS